MVASNITKDVRSVRNSKVPASAMNPIVKPANVLGMTSRRSVHF
jgi:hypothetical protein